MCKDRLVVVHYTAYLWIGGSSLRPVMSISLQFQVKGIVGVVISRRTRTLFCIDSQYAKILEGMTKRVFGTGTNLKGTRFHPN